MWTYNCSWEKRGKEKIYIRDFERPVVTPHSEPLLLNQHCSVSLCLPRWAGEKLPTLNSVLTNSAWHASKLRFNINKKHHLPTQSSYLGRRQCGQSSGVHCRWTPVCVGREEHEHRELTLTQSHTAFTNPRVGVFILKTWKKHGWTCSFLNPKNI